MAGQVTELVALSWIAKPCGRSSRSTGRRTPPGLPSRTAGACATAGTAAATARIRSRTETRMVRRMAESPWVTRLRRPSPGPLPLDRGGEGGEGMSGGSDGDGLVDRHAPLGEAPVGAAHHVHVRGEQALGDRAHPAVAQREAVDREDRGDLVAAAAE